VSFTGQLRHQLAEPLDPPSSEREARPRLRERDSRCGADPAGGARDDGGSALELRHAPELIFEFGLRQPKGADECQPRGSNPRLRPEEGDHQRTEAASAHRDLRAGGIPLAGQNAHATVLANLSQA
jgi:hypothetical protein